MSRGSYARVYTQSTPNARYVTEASFELNSFRRDKRPPFKFMRYFARSGQRSSAYRTENARIVHTGIGIISIPFFLLATIRSLARSRRSSTDASNYPKKKKNEKKTMKSCDVSAERKNCNRLAIRKARANAATSFTYLEKQPWFRVIFDSTCRTVTVAAAKLSYVTSADPFQWNCNLRRRVNETQGRRVNFTCSNIFYLPSDLPLRGQFFLHRVD